MERPSCCDAEEGSPRGGVDSWVPVLWSPSPLLERLFRRTLRKAFWDASKPGAAEPDGEADDGDDGDDASAPAVDAEDDADDDGDAMSSSSFLKLSFLRYSRTLS